MCFNQSVEGSERSFRDIAEFLTVIAPQIAARCHEPVDREVNAAISRRPHMRKDCSDGCNSPPP